MTRRLAPWALFTVVVYVLLWRASDALAGPYPPSLPQDRPSTPVVPSVPPRLAETGVDTADVLVGAVLLLALGVAVLVAFAVVGGARGEKAGRR